MTFRTRLVITAAVVLLVISQVLAADGSPGFAPRRFSLDLSAAFDIPPAAFSCPAGLVQTDTRDKDGEPVTICSVTQEKAGDVFKLHQQVEILSRTFVFSADEVEYNNATGEATATGHVHLAGGPHDEDVRASRGQYNVKNETGHFENVEGSIGLKRAAKRLVLTSSNPFLFSGKQVDKTGPGHYVVHHGRVTVCDEPVPMWSLASQRAVVEVGQDAQMYHSAFLLHNVPVFYLPYAAHPVDQLGRHSGFLIPTIGQSSVKGFTFGESYYWAIDRSTDATLGAEYFSRRGFAQHGNFRWRPSEDAFIEARYFGVLDRSPQNQGGEDFTLTAEGMLPNDVRAVANIEYLSSYLFRLAFNETFTQAVNSEVRSTAFFTKMTGGYFFNLAGRRYQNFESTTHGDLVTILHAPGIELSSADHQLAHTPFVWSYEAAGEGVSRTEPGFSTNQLVGRFDLTPRLSAPIVFHGWSFRPEIALRNTFYSQRSQPNGGLGTPVDDSINRRAIEGAFEFRPPVVGRIFERKIKGRTLKHTIEPRATWRYVNGVGNFNQIIRFDARDIVSDTNEVEYGIVNRLYAKHEVPMGTCPSSDDKNNEDQDKDAKDNADTADRKPCPPGAGVREILTWEVAQKSFFLPGFGGAVVNGRRNVLTTTADFTGIAFLTEPRSWSPLISRLRINTTTNSGLQWNLDYDGQKGRINSSTVLADWHVGDIFFGGSHAYLHVPGEIFVSSSNPIAGPDRFNQFRVLAGYGHPNKRGISVAGNVGFDSNFNFLQYANGQVSYNWDCMGLTVEYRRLALGSVRNENVFRFALSLANIGTFGNLRRQERLF